MRWGQEERERMGRRGGEEEEKGGESHACLGVLPFGRSVAAVEAGRAETPPPYHLRAR